MIFAVLSVYFVYIDNRKISLVVVAVVVVVFPSRTYPSVVQFDQVELSYNVDQGLLIYITLEGLMLYSIGKVHLSEAQNNWKYKMRFGYTTGIIAEIFLQVSRLIQWELNTLISGFKLNLGVYATLRFNVVIKDQTDIPCT